MDVVGLKERAATTSPQRVAVERRCCEFVGEP
jgi:hypothetical protein